MNSSYLFLPHIALDFITDANIVQRYTARYSAEGQARLLQETKAQEKNLHRWQLVQHNILKSEWQALRTVTTDDSEHDEYERETHNEWQAFFGKEIVQS